VQAAAVGGNRGKSWEQRWRLGQSRKGRRRASCLIPM
jgi:hypothetical protein